MPDVITGQEEPEEEDAYRRQDDALRAYHLRRVTSQFRTTISPEGARRLARLLSLDGDDMRKE